MHESKVWKGIQLSWTLKQTSEGINTARQTEFQWQMEDIFKEIQFKQAHRNLQKKTGKKEIQLQQMSSILW